MTNNTNLQENKIVQTYKYVREKPEIVTSWTT